MNDDTAVIPEEVVDDRRRKAALIRALGMERSAPEQVELFLAIARRYDLDPMLKHLVMVEGRPFITRDGLLWIAHRSGVLDGIEVTEPTVVNMPGVGEFWTCTARVWRKDMTRPFEYRGRYPTKGGNTRYAPEMAVKTAESQALRRAFNVSAPTVDERWDLSTVQADVDAVSTPQSPPRSLAERVQERRPGAPALEADSEPASPPAVRPGPAEEDRIALEAEAERLRRNREAAAADEDEVTQASGVRRLEEARRNAARIAGEADVRAAADLEQSAQNAGPAGRLEALCGDEDASPMALGFCELDAGHKTAHRSGHGSWPLLRL